MIWDSLNQNMMITPAIYIYIYIHISGTLSIRQSQLFGFTCSEIMDSQSLPLPDGLISFCTRHPVLTLLTCQFIGNLVIP